MIARGLVLLVVWVALWGELSPANVASGVLVVLGLAVLFPGRGASSHRFRPLPALRFAAYVAVNLVTSSVAVARAVLAPTPDRVHTEVIDVELESASALVAALVANTITLTPGTMTVDIRRESRTVLSVHVLGRVAHDGFRRDIRRLEGLVLAAVRPPVAS